MGGCAFLTCLIKQLRFNFSHAGCGDTAGAHCLPGSVLACFSQGTWENYQCEGVEEVGREHGHRTTMVLERPSQAPVELSCLAKTQSLKEKEHWCQGSATYGGFLPGCMLSFQMNLAPSVIQELTVARGQNADQSHSHSEYAFHQSLSPSIQATVCLPDWSRRLSS